MKEKVSLVLSGGGARGIAHIGVIEVLEENGFEIASIAGTSMGSLVGGIYAIGKMQALKNWLFTLDRRKVFQLVDFTFSSTGLIKGDKVLNTMKQFIADTNIEDLRIPFTATAVDIIHKKEVVFSSGSVYDAIRASIAIPSVLTPVKAGNALLIDGGVMNNLPVANVQRVPNDLLVAVDVNANIPVYTPAKIEQKEQEQERLYKQKMRQFYEQLQKINPVHSDEKQLGYFSLIDETISLMMHHISELSMKNHAPNILINVSRETCNTFDFYRAEELVAIGRQAATEVLNNHKRDKHAIK